MSWWIDAPREGFTSRGAEESRKRSLDPLLERYLAHLEVEFQQTLKEGWVADPESEEEE